MRSPTLAARFILALALGLAILPPAAAQDTETDRDVLLLSPEPGTLVRSDDFNLALSLYFAPEAVDVQRTRLYLDQVDITAEATFRGPFVLYTPPDTAAVEPGPHEVRVMLFTADGTHYKTVTETVTVATPPVEPGRLTGTAGAFGPAMGYGGAVPGRTLGGVIHTLQTTLEYRAEETGSGAFGDNYARGGIDLAGEYEQVRFGARVLLDGRESGDRQPLHRFLAFAEVPFASWGEARLQVGDTYPRMPNQLVSGQRVRGVHAGLRLGFFGVEAAVGQVRRSIDGLARTDTVTAASLETALLITRRDFNAELVGQAVNPDNPALTDYYFETFDSGTFARSYTSLRLAFGQRRTFQFGLSGVRMADDEGSAQVARRPQDNLVVGSDLFLAFDRRRIQLEVEGAVSLTNTDATGGSFTDAQLDSLAAASGGDIDVDLIRDLIDFGDTFITVNENLYPLNPFGSGLPAVMGEGTLTVSYGPNVFRAHAYRRGAAFRTFANPYLQNDLQGLRLSDRARFLDGQVVAEAAIEFRADNVSDTQDFTTSFNDVSGSVSYFPRQDAPAVTVGASRFGRSSDRTIRFVDPDLGETELRALDDSAFRLFLTSTYRFHAFGPQHFALLSLSRLTRDDATAFDHDAANTYAQLAVTSQFATLPLRTRLHLSHSVNDFQIPDPLIDPDPASPILALTNTSRSYTGLGAGVAYEFLDRRLRLDGEVTQYVGDFERTVLRVSGDFELPTGHTVAARLAYYSNETGDDDTIASIVYRFRL